MKILNLGCGHKVSPHADVLNIDWSMYLRMRKNRVLASLAPLLLSEERRARFARLPSNIMAHDLSKGIPFPENSVDVVFHSNVLEHLDRDIAEKFLLEVLRVIKPGGIHRIAVPDFESACVAYVAHIARCDSDDSEAEQHEEYIARILEQSVRREAAGTRLQSPLRRRIENLLLGDARRRGETHQWMYDRISLSTLLRMLGYHQVRSWTFDSSGVPGWAALGLDTNADGTEYAPGSIYIEARKQP